MLRVSWVKVLIAVATLRFNWVTLRTEVQYM